MRLPLKITRHEESYSVSDADGKVICYIYYDNDDERRAMAGRWTSSEAETMAKAIARALSGHAPIPREGGL